MAAGLDPNTKKLRDRLVEAVKAAVDVECAVNVREVKKNNGQVLQGIEIRKPGENVAPVIYSNGILKMIRSGEVSLQDAARRIADIYRENHSSPWIQDAVSDMSKEYILRKAVYQVVNAEKNAGCLERVPHIKFLDLAAVYRMTIDNADGSIMISQSLCDKFAITAAELDAAARRNTENMGFSTRCIEEIIGGWRGLLKTDMWVITNATGFNGAAAMLSDCLHSLAEQIGDDLYILPSSIHEVLAVPIGGRMTLAGLRDIVCSVNAHEVASEDVLSDNVYRYNRKDRRLSIAQGDVNDTQDF